MHILNEQHQKGQLYAQLRLAVGGTVYECGGDIGTHNFEYQRLNVFIVDTFNISVLSLCTKHIRFY